MFHVNSKIVAEINIIFTLVEVFDILELFENVAFDVFGILSLPFNLCLYMTLS